MQALNKLIFMLMVLFLASAQHAGAQNQDSMKNYPGAAVMPMLQTYDGGLLLQVNFMTPDSPVYLIKNTMAGETIWKKKLDKTYGINSIINTSDSGFIMTMEVLNQPKKLTAPPADSSYSEAMMKFDKCGLPEWSRVFVSKHGNSSGNIIEYKDNYYVLLNYVNPSWSQTSKTMDVIKMSRNGEYIRQQAFSGEYGTIYQKPGTDTFYLVHVLYMPVGDTTFTMPFSGVQMFDTVLHASAKTSIGYRSHFNTPGPAVVNGDSVKEFGAGVLIGKGRQKLMVSAFSCALQPGGKYLYDSISNADLTPVYADEAGDTTLVCYNVKSTANQYTALKLYDRDYRVIKEQRNDKFKNEPSKILRLRDGRIIAAVRDISTAAGNKYSILYLYSSALAPLAWPAKDSTKYDWACTASLGAFDEYDPVQMAPFIRVKIDTSKIDWSFWSGIAEQNSTKTGILRRWQVWPQPSAPGENIHIRMQSPEVEKPADNMACDIYDTRGRLMVHFDGIHAAKGFDIRPGTLMPGVYTIRLAEKQADENAVYLKLVVQ